MPVLKGKPAQGRKVLQAEVRRKGPESKERSHKCGRLLRGKQRQIKIKDKEKRGMGVEATACENIIDGIFF